MTPSYEDLVSWAGDGQVARANPDRLAGWQIPEEQKLILIGTGVPVVKNLIDFASFQSEQQPALATNTGAMLYRLTENYNRTGGRLVWAFGAEPETGTVRYVLPDGDAWFANSSIGLWLETLHHYGTRVSRSEILRDADNREEEALAELQGLADELRAIDPPAFDGYRGHIWAEFLDRWLW